MSWADVAEFAKQFGMAGPFVAYLIWERKERNALDEKRVAADIKQAEAMTLMAERLGHVR